MPDLTEQEIHLRDQLRQKLKGFSSNIPAGFDYYSLSKSRPPREDFPVPEVVLYVLRNILGWQWSGNGDKVRWSVYGSVDGEPIVFELQKFGFTLLSNNTLNTMRIIGPLKSAVKAAEKHLKALIEQQITQNDVLIANYFSEFTSRYRFFRDLADHSYRRAKRKPRAKLKEHTEGTFSIISESLNAHHQKMLLATEGFYYSVAMVDCYFSALEHRLTLLRAFTGKAMTTDGLRSFLSKKWDAKLTEVLGPTQTPEARNTIHALREIKERIRNPFAHGGFENDKGALFVHIPSIGCIPGNITKFGKSPRFSLIPVEANDHLQNCKVFDHLDELLSTGLLEAPHRLMQAGVDPSFEREMIKCYSEVVSGEESELEEFIHHWGEMWSREANMDY